MEKLREIGITAENPHIKMTSLYKMLDENRFISAVMDVYKALSGILYNHHIHTRFHSLEKINTEDSTYSDSDVRVMMVADRA